MKNENQKSGNCDLNKIIALQEQTLIDQRKLIESLKRELELAHYLINCLRQGQKNDQLFHHLSN